MRNILGIIMAMLLLGSTAGMASADTVRISPAEPLGTIDNPATFGTTIQIGSLDITLMNVSVDETHVSLEFKMKSNREIRPLQIDMFDFLIVSHEQQTFCDDDGGDKTINFGSNLDNVERYILLEAGQEHDVTVRCASFDGDVPAPAEAFYFAAYIPGEDEFGAAWYR